ncbi:hypothetical protein C8J56DRAFT_5728 [Mycena floridula]|nr:hypothetical protein C8J56DRAFT_5728 [Mycena floridula]
MGVHVRKPERVEPAPGTFGYDHSKYRPPRAGDEFSPVPFDEFGCPTRVAELDDNEGQEISRLRSHRTKFGSKAMVDISSLLHLLFSFHITLLLRQQRPTYRNLYRRNRKRKMGLAAANVSLCDSSFGAYFLLIFFSVSIIYMQILFILYHKCFVSIPHAILFFIISSFWRTFGLSPVIRSFSA